jgi:hypothetical protein
MTGSAASARCTSERYAGWAQPRTRLGSHAGTHTAIAHAACAHRDRTWHPQTYEVHYVHSNAAPGTDMNPIIGDGLAVAAGAARGLLNPQVVVEAMVYTIVNDNAPAYTHDDLVHGWDLPGLDTSSRVMYPGSTTGNSFNNEFCSPFTVSWHVDKKCHAVSASSFDQMCCTMRDTYGMKADLSPHSARQIVSPQWVAPGDEVLPLA